MDKMSKLSLLFSTLAVAGLLAGDLSAMSRSEFATVREYVENGDATGLRNYLAVNPDVLDSSPLGRELASFLSAPSQDTVFSRLGLKNPVPKSVRDTVESAKTNDNIY